jgi:hypothetical protein
MKSKERSFLTPDAFLGWIVPDFQIQPHFPRPSQCFLWQWE